jgi:opacity protein-like surface antigen
MIMDRKPTLQYLAVALAATLTVVLAPASKAQEYTGGTARMEAGGGLEYAQPLGDFRQNVRQGFGGAGHFLFGVDPDAIISIRADAGFINYGSETHYLPLSSSVRRIVVQENTTNNIFIASVGPQITFPIGRIRPYVNAGIGFAYLYTQSSLNADDESDPIAQTTNYSDNSVAYTGGAGFNIPLTTGRQSISIDVGARYNSVGSARYLTKGDIVDDPNDPYGIIITPHESAVNFVAYHLGASFRF